MNNYNITKTTLFLVVYHVLYIFLQIHFSFGKILSNIYSKILWGHLKIDWFDPEFNIPYFKEKLFTNERYILANLYTRKDHTVLDIGCGEGFGTLLLANKALHVTGIDRDELAIKIANKRSKHVSNTNYIWSSFEKKIDHQHSYDIIFCFSVLNFLNNETAESIIKNAIINLKNGGTFMGSLSLNIGQDENYLSKTQLNMLLNRYFHTTQILQSEWDDNRIEQYFICKNPKQLE